MFINFLYLVVVVGLLVVVGRLLGGRITGFIGGAGGLGPGGRRDAWDVVGGPIGGAVGL